MPATCDSNAERTHSRTSIADTLAVYLQRRVLVVLLLGFSSGLPIVLVGSTLQAWMKESGIDIKTIGLFAAVAVPYNVKFLWAPLVDSLDVPVLGRLLGRRRAWLIDRDLYEGSRDIRIEGDRQADERDDAEHAQHREHHQREHRMCDGPG